ncbi:MAG TPA: hypothetical protein VGB37_05795, partial [Candidatus Lokiarchaeia archaeon]
MSEKEFLEQLRDDIDSTIANINKIHREDYIKRSIDVLTKYIEKLTPIDIAFAIKELFFVDSLDPSVLEGHPSFSIEGPARSLYVLEDCVINVQEIIEEVKKIAPESIQNILEE